MNIQNDMLQEWFIGNGLGFIIPNEIIPTKIHKEVSWYRQGQLVNILGEFLVRGNSNILCKRKEFFEPIQWNDIQEFLGIKNKAMYYFKKDMVKLNRIKEVNGNLFINPTFVIAFDLDFIRDELKEIFPTDSDNIDIINSYLRGEHGRRQ